MRRDIKVIFTDYTISVTHLSFYLEVNKKAKHVLLLKLRMITTPSASDTNQNKNSGHASNVCSSQPVNEWRHEYLPVCTYLNTITKGCVPSVDTAPWLKKVDCSVCIGVSRLHPVCPPVQQLAALLTIKFVCISYSKGTRYTDYPG